MGNSPQCLAVEGRLAALIGEAGEAISALHWCNVCQSVKPEKLAPCVAVGVKLAALVWTVRVELAALLGGRRTTRRTDW